MVVSLDLIISLIFMIAVIRLRYYEKLAINDIRDGKSKIEDFTVFIKKIPIKREEYDNNPELLKAMIAVHLENVIQSEPQINDIPEHQRYEVAVNENAFGQLINMSKLHTLNLTSRRLKECDVISINFGMTSFSVMSKLISIQAEIKDIQSLYQRRENDPLRQVEYEREIWKKYKEVTNIKNEYYKERTYSTPEMQNVFVTFRSMEGKQRTMQAYQAKRVRRWMTEFFCCMRKSFDSKKLNGTGYYDIDETVDPDIICWENIGKSKINRVKEFGFSIFKKPLCLNHWA